MRKKVWDASPCSDFSTIAFNELRRNAIRILHRDINAMIHEQCKEPEYEAGTLKFFETDVALERSEIALPLHALICFN